MYIDTHSRESMEKSICNIFQMHQLELREQLLLMGVCLVTMIILIS